MTDQLAWMVSEQGKKVIIEIFCRDAYEAIELAEMCSLGLAKGRLILEIEDDV